MMNEHAAGQPEQVVLGEGTGPLRGVRVVEIAGIGPGPHACMILADLGADVIRIERPGGHPLSAGPFELLNRGRPSVALDLKHPRAVETVLDLVATADILIEGMRPGVTERLGIGPEPCLERNPRLVYGRMTGWGQDGPLANTAGHDLNYISVIGALATMGQDRTRPHFPSNLVGDFGGGSAYLVIGVLSALLEARVSGCGQVVDAAVVDGAAHLNAMASGYLAAGQLGDERAGSLLDGGVPYYDVYETADGRHMSVGAIEPQFYARFVDLLGIADIAPDRDDAARHSELRELIAATFRTRPQADWVRIFEGTDACVAGIITMSEAADHPHLKAREVFVRKDDVLQPAPAPRFSRTAPTLGLPPAPEAGRDTVQGLNAWGIKDVDGLLREGVAVQLG